MTLTSDVRSPRLDVPFHVTVSIRVRENVATLPNVFLPNFIGPEELGDERTVTHTAHGTLYRETLTLEALSRGTLQITPAYMDAIDARDHKPKRFFSNALTLQVQGGPLLDIWTPLRRLAETLLVALLVMVLAIASLCVVYAAFWRRRPRQRPAEPQPLPVLPAVDEPKPEDLLANLRARRDRGSVLELRRSVWLHFGAQEGATLADVLRLAEASSEEERGLLTAIERAAFVEDARLQGAIEDVIARCDRGVKV